MMNQKPGYKPSVTSVNKSIDSIDRFRGGLAVQPSAAGSACGEAVGCSAGSSSDANSG